MKNDSIKVPCVPVCVCVCVDKSASTCDWNCDKMNINVERNLTISCN